MPVGLRPIGYRGGEGAAFRDKGAERGVGSGDIESQARGGPELHGVAEFLADLNAEN